MVRPATSSQYDEALGGVYHLVTHQTNPDGTYVVYTYDANGLTARQPSTQKTYSAGDVLVQTRSYTYDPFGNTLTETDPANNTTTFTYTAAGLVSQMARPGTPTRTFLLVLAFADEHQIVGIVPLIPRHVLVLTAW